jgi:hypothetical protein
MLASAGPCFIKASCCPYFMAIILTFATSVTITNFGILENFLHKDSQSFFLAMEAYHYLNQFAFD